MNLRSLILLFLLVPSLVKAGEWNTEISGEVRGFYGYTDSRKQKDNHIVGDGELNSTLFYDFNEDYGISFHIDFMVGADKELQNYNQGKWGEEIYSILNTPYGQLMVGQMFNVAYQFSDGVPTTGVFTNTSDIVDFISNPNWQRNTKQTKFVTLNATYINTDGVAPKISYVSPEFYGTGIGFSYTPKSYNRRGLINSHAPYKNKSGYIGAIYTSQEISGLYIDASLATAKFHDDDNEYSASVRLSYGNWNIGGGWRKTDVNGKRTYSQDYEMPEFFDGYREGQAWDIGIGYKIGPLQTTLSYFESKSNNSNHQDKIWSLSNRYQVNQNAAMTVAVANVDF